MPQKNVYVAVINVLLSSININNSLQLIRATKTQARRGRFKKSSSMDVLTDLFHFNISNFSHHARKYQLTRSTYQVINKDGINKRTILT